MVQVHVKFLVRHVTPPVDVTSLIYSGERSPTYDVRHDVKLELVGRYDDVRLRLWAGGCRHVAGFLLSYFLLLQLLGIKNPNQSIIYIV